MLLGYWARTLERPELEIPTADIAGGVHDPGWQGTGNWSFNAAYAGARPGLVGAVGRLGGLTDLEAWLRAGVPVAASIAYGVLKSGVREENDGHLVVVIGTTPDGSVVVNDPGSRTDPQRIVPRNRFAEAWSVSRNTVYVVHPAGQAVPPALRDRWLVR
jgi:hypothetical protein